jgi:serine/threonine-protein kinase SRPK3
MIELLGPIPRNMALAGTKYKKIFTSDGNLKRIKGLKYWPLHKVLEQKYKFKKEDFCSRFYIPGIPQSAARTSKRALVKEDRR